MTMHPDDRQQPARLNVRLDDELRSRIEAAAQASRRSMNAEICYRIEQAFIEQRPDEADSVNADNNNSETQKNAPPKRGKLKDHCHERRTRSRLRAQ
jgi:hypothetical protein